MEDLRYPFWDGALLKIGVMWNPSCRIGDLRAFLDSWSIQLEQRKLCTSPSLSDYIRSVVEGPAWLFGAGIGIGVKRDSAPHDALPSRGSGYPLASFAVRSSQLYCLRMHNALTAVPDDFQSQWSRFPFQVDYPLTFYVVLDGVDSYGCAKCRSHRFTFTPGVSYSNFAVPCPEMDARKINKCPRCGGLDGQHTDPWCRILEVEGTLI